jgi:hypothetical protein
LRRSRTRGIELECARAAIQSLPLGFQLWPRAARVDADASQDARKALHVLLGVTGADAERMQLHKLARIVFVDMVDSVLGIVQVLQHRRMREGCHHKVPEVSQYVRTDSVLLVVADEPANAALRLRYAEVIEPKPDELLLHLRGRVNGSQHIAARRLIGKRVAAIVEGFACLLLLGPIRHGADALVLGIGRGEELRCIRARATSRALISPATMVGRRGSRLPSCSSRNAVRPRRSYSASVTELTP